MRLLMPLSLCLSLSLFGAGASAADLTVTVLDRTGKPLADAVVLADSPTGGPRPAPVLEATVAQQKLRFLPAVTVVGVGAKINFTNRDSWDHHVILGLMGPGGVYLDPGLNVQFRLAGQLAGKPPASETRQLGQTGAFLLGCHLHSSMRGHIYVADTPWAKLVGEDGQVTLTGLPAGPVRVRVWHPDQLLDGAATVFQLTATGSAVTVNTQIAAARKRRASGDSAGS